MERHIELAMQRECGAQRLELLRWQAMVDGLSSPRKLHCVLQKVAEAARRERALHACGRLMARCDVTNMLCTAIHVPKCRQAWRRPKTGRLQCIPGNAVKLMSRLANSARAFAADTNATPGTRDPASRAETTCLRVISSAIIVTHDTCWCTSP